MVFAKFGMDKVMGHPRGAGFVKFSRGEDAEKCMEVREGCLKDHDKMILNLGVHGNRKFRIMMAQPGDGRGGAEAKRRGRRSPKAELSENGYPNLLYHHIIVLLLRE